MEKRIESWIYCIAIVALFGSLSLYSANESYAGTASKPAPPQQAMYHRMDAKACLAVAAEAPVDQKACYSAFAGYYECLAMPLGNDAQIQCSRPQCTVHKTMGAGLWSNWLISCNDK